MLQSPSILPRRMRRRAACILALGALVTFGSVADGGAVHAATAAPTAPELVTAAATGALAADDAITCPIPSGSEFVDSWGAGRSGGRRHQGVDMIADRGTPVVAVQSGEVNFKRSRLGGNAAWLHSPSGNEFYYAHFDSFEGESRFVLRGEVIGYVGSSGNAKGPHLHFETHFGGEVGNPYPATFAACVQPEIDALAALADARAAAAAIHGEFKVTARTTMSATGDHVAPGTTVRR